MVYQDIKDTFLSKVAGTCPERLFYRVLCFLAGVAFLFAVLNVGLKAQEPLTEVTIEIVEAFPWPVMFFCFQGNKVEDELALETKPRSGCKDQAVLRTLDLTGQTQLKSECLDFMKSTTHGGTSTLAYELEQRWHRYSTEFNRDPVTNPTGAHDDKWQCVTLNEDGQLASTPNMHRYVEHEWFTTLQANKHHEHNYQAWSGILDPKLKTYAEQTKNGLTVFEIGMVNTKSQVTFSVDKLVEQDISSIFTSSKLGGKARALGEVAMKDRVQDILKDDHVQLKYNPSMNIQPHAPVTINGGRQESRMVYQPLNYVSRVVTKRYKTWDEIWAEIGGTWATAVLLVSAFFARKTVEDPKKKGEEGAPMDEVQVFRLRGVSSKKQALKTMYAMAGDAYGAAKENKEQAVDPETLARQ